MKPAIFLDRDGTINRNCPYCSTADEIHVYEDVYGPIRELSKEYLIIIVTNQSGVARGYFTRKDLDSMHRKIRREIAKRHGRIDAVYYCPHMPDSGCRCRKPGTGMIDKAMRDFSIDLSRSFVVGDSDADVGMARGAGITSIMVRGRGKSGPAPDFRARNFHEAMRIIRKAEKARASVPSVGVILAGGEGTRMRPLTYKMPKPMARVNGKPLIEHIIGELASNGVRDLFISVGYKADMIKRHLGNGSRLGTRIRYVSERTPLGTGGGTRLALRAVRKEYGNTDVFMTNGDDLFALDVAGMYRLHKKSGALGTLALMKVKDVTGSGVVVLRGSRITKFVEKPDNESTPSRLVNLGKYILNTRIVDRFPKARKFSLEKEFLQKKAGRIRLSGYVARGRWHQINTVEALEKAKSEWT